MICCLNDCPHFSPSAGETQICKVCDKEYLLAHLTDAVSEVDRAIEFVDWRFCMDGLKAVGCENPQLDRARAMLATLDQSRTELMELFGLQPPSGSRKNESAI